MTCHQNVISFTKVDRQINLFEVLSTERLQFKYEVGSVVVILRNFLRQDGDTNYIDMTQMEEVCYTDGMWFSSVQG